MGEKKLKVKISIFLDIAFCIFFAIASNSDWMSNPIVWWGSIALIFVVQFIIYGGKLNFPISKYKIWAALFLMTCMFSLVYSINKNDSINVIKTLIVLALVMIYVESELNDYYSIEKMMSLYVIGIGITLLYVLLTQDMKQFQLAIVGEGNTGRWNGNDIGMNAAVCVTMIIYLFPRMKSRFIRIYYLIIGTASFYLMYWMGSRKTIVFFVLAICGIILLRQPKKIVRNLIIVICIMTVSWSLVMEVPALYKNVGWRLEALTASVTGKGTVDSSTLLREKYIKVGKEAFKKSPIIGYGINSYREINKLKTGHKTYSHNNFIEIAVGIGLMGLITYYWLYAYLIFGYLRILIYRKTSFLTSFLFVLFILYLFTQVGLVVYDGLVQWMFLLLLFKAIGLDLK